MYVGGSCPFLWLWLSGSKTCGFGGSGSATLVFHLSHPSFFLFFLPNNHLSGSNRYRTILSNGKTLLNFAEPAVRDEFPKCECPERGSLFRVRCCGGLHPEAAAASRITSPRQPTLLPLLRGAEVLVRRVCVAGWWPDTLTREIKTERLYFSITTVCSSIKCWADRQCWGSAGSACDWASLIQVH